MYLFVLYVKQLIDPSSVRRLFYNRHANATTTFIYSLIVTKGIFVLTFRLTISIIDHISHLQFRLVMGKAIKFETLS
jgi:hypothetical protein